MRRLSSWFGSLSAVAGLALAAACGGDKLPESMVDGTGGTGNSSTGASSNGGSIVVGGTSSGGGNGTAATGNDISFGGEDGGTGTGGTESCASATQEAELAPVYLVFLLDESGSMGDGEHGDPTKKWDPVTSALKAFFADPESSGITASLSLFPLDKTPPGGPAVDSVPADCDADVYSVPEVDPTPLPDDKAFADAMTKVGPPNEFGTPTLPALSGTITYAESLLAEDASRKVAIVMVTDGDPVSCDGNTIPATAAAAMAVADHIPTYVIGVGESLDSLDAIAKGGGTDQAFIVSLTDPEKTRTELLDAIELIRGQSVACELDIPAPPPGKKLDPNKVNVHYSGEAQADTSLKYGTDCTGDTAWHYDDEQKPTKILLCDDTCAAVKADAKAKLGVEFACVDRVVVQ